MKTATQMMEEGLITEEQLPELLKDMTEEEALRFLEIPQVELPMSKEEIIRRTLWMGEIVLNFLEETYPEMFRMWLVSEELLPMVESRVNEAKEVMNDYLHRNMCQTSGLDTMEAIQQNNQVYSEAKELVIKEILTRPLDFQAR